MSKTTNKTTISLEEFSETYNNFDELFGSGFSEAEKRKELAKAYKVHGNTITNLIKRAKDVGFVDSTNSLWVNDDSVTETENVDEFFTHAKSTLYGPEGEVKLEWVKTKLNEAKFHNAMKTAIKDMFIPFEGNYTTKQVPKFSDDDLCTFYPLPDTHMGLLVEGMEVTHGKDWNLQIAKDSVLAAMKHLVDSAPYSADCIITDLGDFLEADDDSNRTKRSGNILNTSDMHSKIIRTSFELVTKLIEMALEKHERVFFYSLPGNHADMIPLYLTTYLDAYFKNEPRVIIDIKDTAQKYHHFGKNIIGFTHGHQLRPEGCSEVLIHDNREVFSSMQYAYYHFGHFHTNRRMTEMSLVNVEIHKNIIPTNKWANNMGFRAMSIGEAKCITYHKNYGEVSRSVFNMHILD